MKTFIIFLLMGLSSYAQTQNEKMRVTIIDDNIKKSDFPADTQFDNRKKKMSFTLQERTARFEKLKLTVHAEKMDELGRDLLYMDLKNNSIETLIKTYPTIPPQVLTDAKNNFNQ